MKKNNKDKKGEDNEDNMDDENQGNENEKNLDDKHEEYVVDDHKEVQKQMQRKTKQSSGMAGQILQNVFIRRNRKPMLAPLTLLEDPIGEQDIVVKKRHN